jgi:hypothetical protein
MWHRANRRHCAASRSPGDRLTWYVAILRLLPLLVMLLLPVQMRAGAADAHPHTLLQLLLDARDGSLDHHQGDHAPGDGQATSVASEGSRGHGPDVPTYEDIGGMGMGVPILAATVALIALLVASEVPVWPRLSRWRDRLPVLDPPPPRQRFA